MKKTTFKQYAETIARAERLRKENELFNGYLQTLKESQAVGSREDFESRYKKELKKLQKSYSNKIYHLENFEEINNRKRQQAAKKSGKPFTPMKTADVVSKKERILKQGAAAIKTAKEEIKTRESMERNIQKQRQYRPFQGVLLENEPVFSALAILRTEIEQHNENGYKIDINGKAGYFECIKELSRLYREASADGSNAAASVEIQRTQNAVTFTANINKP